MSTSRRLVLLDSHALLFRAYHAMPGFTGPDGRPTGAVYGFSNVLIRVLRELEPTWIVATFDSAGPTFREASYPAYKATRTETPEDIIVQEPMVKEVVEAFGIPHCAVSGFEADDLIGTLVSQALDNDVGEVVVVTGDRDLLQLSGPKVTIYLLRQSMKDINLLDEAAVTELIGVPPVELLEWKALRGDSSDNIVGVPGVGDKTALGLITHYHSLEALYVALAAGANDFKISDRIKASLLLHRERAFLNRELMTVRRDAPISLDLAAASRMAYRQATAVAALRKFGFQTILSRVPADQFGQQTSLF